MPIDPTEAEMLRVLKAIDADPARYKGLAPFGLQRSADEQADQMAAVYMGLISQE